MEKTDIMREVLEAVLGCCENLKIIQLRLRRYLVSDEADRYPGSASGVDRRRIMSSLSSTESENALGTSRASLGGSEDIRRSPGHLGDHRDHRDYRDRRYHRDTAGGYRDHRKSRGHHRDSQEDYRESRGDYREVRKSQKPPRDTPGSRRGPGRPRKVAGEVYSSRRESRESPPAAKKARIDSRGESREARQSVERPVLEAKRGRGRPKKPVDPNTSPVVKRRRGRPSIQDIRSRDHRYKDRGDGERAIINMTSDISKDVEDVEAVSPLYSRVSDADSVSLSKHTEAHRATEAQSTAAVQGMRREVSEVLSSPDSLDAVVVPHGSAIHALEEHAAKEDSLLLEMEEDTEPAEETAGEAWWHSRRVAIEWAAESMESGRQTVSGTLLDSEPLEGASVSVRWPHPSSHTKYSATVLGVLAD